MGQLPLPGFIPGRQVRRHPGQPQRLGLGMAARDGLNGGTPPILAAENVVNLVSRQDGGQYRQLHEAMTERGYHIV